MNLGLLIHDDLLGIFIGWHFVGRDLAVVLLMVVMILLQLLLCGLLIHRVSNVDVSLEHQVLLPVMVVLSLVDHCLLIHLLLLIGVLHPLLLQLQVFLLLLLHLLLILFLLLSQELLLLLLLGHGLGRLGPGRGKFSIEHWLLNSWLSFFDDRRRAPIDPHELLLQLLLLVLLLLLLQVHCRIIERGAGCRCVVVESFPGFLMRLLQAAARGTQNVLHVTALDDWVFLCLKCLEGHRDGTCKHFFTFGCRLSRPTLEDLIDLGQVSLEGQVLRVYRHHWIGLVRRLVHKWQRPR